MDTKYYLAKIEYWNIGGIPNFLQKTELILINQFDLVNFGSEVADGSKRIETMEIPNEFVPIIRGALFIYNHSKAKS